MPDGEVTRYGYNALNRLTSMNESQGTTTLFSETLILNDDGSRASATESQLQTDGTTSTLNYAWGYDADGRLKTESLSATGDAATDDYADAYTFDLTGNIITDVHTGPGNGASATTTNAYNGDDQLMNASTGAVVTHYDYDPNGSQIDIKVNGTTTATYSYDVRNKMVGYSTSTGTTASYVYNDDGNRVAETTGGTTTYYLADTQNPTGYAQPVEEHQGSTTSVPTKTYLTGDHIFGQLGTGSATAYFMIDVHGSTIAFTDSTVATTQTLVYTAYGNALNFNPVTVGSAYLFGGDSIYDPLSGTFMHGDGTRDAVGFGFIQADDEGDGSKADPSTLHRYLLDDGDAISTFDPTGHFPSWLLGIFVHQQIGNDFTVFGTVPNRTSNRSIRTIITRVTGIQPPLGVNMLLSPDLAEWSGGTGSLYEIKPGDIESYLTDATFLAEAAQR